MGGKHSVKNLKEILTVVKVASIVVIREVVKDGYQHKDLGAFLKSPEFEAAIKPAIEDAHLAVSEVTELDFFDGLDLGRHVYTMADEILDELKKLKKA